MKKIKNNENGQTIVLFVLSIFALVSMAALIIDGGNLYLKRRSAQTAADAAALAGVYERCINEGDNSSISNIITQYATVENGGTTVTWWPLSDKEIEVEVTLTEATFFANIFGIGETTITTQASAGCFYPIVGEGLLPMSWACQNIEGEYQWDSGDCKYKALDWETEFVPVRDNSSGTITLNQGDADEYDVILPFDFTTDYLHEIYIIGDSESLPATLSGICGEDGFVCDIDGDGRDDFQGEGDIGWLDLDGGGGAMEESWFIDSDIELAIHMWIPSQTGVIGAFFNKNGVLHDLVNSVVSVPVFNQFCTTYLDETCENVAHDPVLGLPDPNGDENWVEGGGVGTTYYHLAGIGYFVITCVHGPGTGDCPGQLSLDEANSSNLSSIKTIEGYFVKNVPQYGTPGSGGVDLGNYIISLIP